MSIIRKFTRYYRPHRGLLFLDLGTALLRSVLTIFIPLLTTRMLQDYLPMGDLRYIGMSIVGLFALAAGVGGCIYVNTRWGHTLGARMETDMRADLFAHLQKLSFNYFDSTKTGHIMSRISNDLFTIAEVAHHAPEDLFISICLLAGALIVMFNFNVTLALLALIPLAPMIIWGSIFRKRMRSGFRRVRRRIADINSNVENSIQGIREVKSYTNEDYEIEKFAEVNTEFRFAKENMYGVMASFHSGMRFLSEAYFLTIVGGGAVLIYYGRLDLPVLIGFMMYARFIIRPIERLVNFVEQYQQGVASFERFVEVMEVEPDITDRPHAIDPGRLKGHIAFEGVSCTYNHASEPALSDIDLSIPPGHTVALVGESGAGKTTLASLIPRFYEPGKGSILIDGHNIMDLKQQALRRNIGIVQQDVFLFDSSIRDNIMFGNPNASETDLIQAARNANIYDLIQSLPDGFDSRVGEHGVKLSGGEKQRVSIARIFLKKPSILVFDEATSSLDTESEVLIQNSMDLLCQGLTTIIIAHRLSTVKNADYTYVLRYGRVIEQGKHEELLEKKGYYHQLYTNSLF